MKRMKTRALQLIAFAAVGRLGGFAPAAAKPRSKPYKGPANGGAIPIAGRMARAPTGRPRTLCSGREQIRRSKRATADAYQFARKAAAPDRTMMDTTAEFNIEAVKGPSRKRSGTVEANDQRRPHWSGATASVVQP